MTTHARLARRIDAPVTGRRGTRVIALDDRAATVVRRLTGRAWNGAHFATLAAGAPGSWGDGVSDLRLHVIGAGPTGLASELSGADVVLMVAVGDGPHDQAGVIGRDCAERGITVAAVVLGEQRRVVATLGALRPYTDVLLVTTDEQDVAGLLTALRA